MTLLLLKRLLLLFQCFKGFLQWDQNLCWRRRIWKFVTTDSRPSSELAFSSVGGERAGCVEGCVLKIIFFKSPLDSCRSVGASFWCENSQFHVFLTSFFRNSGKNLSYVDSTAPTSLVGDFGLLLKSMGAAKNCCFPKGQVLLDWVWLWGYAYAY